MNRFVVDRIHEDVGCRSLRIELERHSPIAGRVRGWPQPIRQRAPRSGHAMTSYRRTAAKWHYPPRRVKHYRQIGLVFFQKLTEHAIKRRYISIVKTGSRSCVEVVGSRVRLALTESSNSATTRVGLLADLLNLELNRETGKLSRSEPVLSCSKSLHKLCKPVSSGCSKHLPCYWPARCFGRGRAL